MDFWLNMIAILWSKGFQKKCIVLLISRGSGDTYCQSLK